MRATMFAESVGLKNVYNITGGIMSWEMAGLPIKQ
jgi:rhodanese-related sulfurtransferase